MVVAGPGAGKTTTAVALIAAVLDRVDTDSMVLFVSFSNAAIDAALASMIDLDEGHGERVMAMTLDSLAAQLVDDAPPFDRQPDFTSRLNRATEHLTAGDGDELSAIGHLIVDESQDMTAERRAFLLAIIDSLPPESGFTIFGDPWQAIYTFDGTDGTSSGAWDALRRSLNIDGSSPPMLVLGGEYRARSTQLRRITKSLAGIRARSVDRSVVERHLEEALIEAAEIDLSGLQRRLAGWKGTTAVLTWRNSDVLALVDAIRRRGVQCDRIEPLGSSAARIAAWVAELFVATSGRPFDAAEFDDFCSHHPEVRREWFSALAYSIEATSPSLAWSLIAKMMQCDRSRDRPWHERPADISVSTIHQSKGREFDNVVIANPSRLLRPSTGDAQLELLYVALTRAHDRVFALDWHAPWNEVVAGTTTRFRVPPGRKRPNSLSVVSSDVRRTGSVGGQRGQVALAAARPGDLIRFERLNSTDLPVFRLILDGEAVGVTTEQFGSIVKRLFRGRWPSLGPVPLEGVETIVSTFPETNFSLQPRLAGFADLTF